MTTFAARRTLGARGIASLTLAVLLAWGASTAGGARAQNFPQRPVRIVVPLSPGGGVDALARILAQHLGSSWGQTCIVENRAGAGGSIGIEIASKATPDGHTLLMTSTTVVTNAATRPIGTPGYDPVRDLTAVSRLTAAPYLLAVTAALPAANVQQLVALAKSRSSGVRYASAGQGSITHMGAELLRSMANVPMTHVPYRGVADAYPAVVAGQVDWILGNPISVMPLITAGRLKSIATTGKTRLKAFPDVPTVAESGLPGYEVVGWYGLFAPPRVATGLVAKLHAEVKRVMHLPDVVRRMEAESAEVIANAPAEFAREVKAEFDKWRDLAAGMTPQ